jgi:hypothetical protein
MTGKAAVSSAAAEGISKQAVEKMATAHKNDKSFRITLIQENTTIYLKKKQYLNA